MKNQTPKAEGKRKPIAGSRSMNMKTMSNNKKNKMRMGGGGGGLSLEAFANAKLKSDHYNPSLIKKQREFYKNAKYVNKYKKSLKQQSQQSDHILAAMPLVDETESGDSSKKKNKRNSSGSMRELYEKKHEMQEKERIEKEAIMQAKQAEREAAVAHRKTKREKMFKRTRFGQPIMKHRIEHLLQTIQASSENAANK